MSKFKNLVSGLAASAVITGLSGCPTTGLPQQNSSKKVADAYSGEIKSIVKVPLEGTSVVTPKSIPVETQKTATPEYKGLGKLTLGTTTFVVSGSDLTINVANAKLTNADIYGAKVSFLKLGSNAVLADLIKRLEKGEEKISLASLGDLTKYDLEKTTNADRTVSVRAVIKNQIDKYGNGNSTTESKIIPVVVDQNGNIVGFGDSFSIYSNADKYSPTTSGNTSSSSTFTSTAPTITPSSSASPSTSPSPSISPSSTPSPTPCVPPQNISVLHGNGLLNTADLEGHRINVYGNNFNVTKIKLVRATKNSVTAIITVSGAPTPHDEVAFYYNNKQSHYISDKTHTDGTNDFLVEIQDGTTKEGVWKIVDGDVNPEFDKGAITVANTCSN